MKHGEGERQTSPQTPLHFRSLSGDRRLPRGEGLKNCVLGDSVLGEALKTYT
jgi:hypothetical protein